MAEIDNELLSEMTACAEQEVIQGQSLGCQLAAEVRLIYPYELSPVETCPPVEPIATGQAYLDMISRWDTILTDPQRAALQEHLRSEWLRHRKRYQEQVAYCSRRAPSPAPEPPSRAPEPEPEPEPQPEPKVVKAGLSPWPFAIAAGVFVWLFMRKR